MAPPTTKPLLRRFSLVPGFGMILDCGVIMQFSIGLVVFLSSMLLLAVLAKLAAAKPDTALLRGEFAPAMLSVLISGGLAIGFVMMAIGGETYFASRTTEYAVIFAVMFGGGWLVTRLVGRSGHLPA